MSLPVTAVLLLPALPAALASTYLLALTLLSWRLPAPPLASRRLRFDLVVPAHDEAAVIGRTLASLQRIDWPAERLRILVVCDNCSDATAEIVRAAGAQALERSDPMQRGKGYALRHAFEVSAAAGWADAVAVVDADSEVLPNLLAAFAARLESGAGAVQAHYGVLNPQASLRTRLMTLAFACQHRLRSRARERLRLSCGVRGNGWCLSRQVLEQVPYRAYSLAEDLEYGIRLGLAGVRVHYADEAEVLGEMAAGATAACSQRRRWEGGRLLLLRRLAAPLLTAALRRRSAVCLDLALDLLLPPLTYVVLGAGLWLVLAGTADAWRAAFAPWWFGACACALSLGLYVLRGWQLSGLGARALFDLLSAPAFMLWKLRLMLGSRGGGEWIRTQRERA